MIEITRHARAKMAERGIRESEALDTLELGEFVEARGARMARRRVFTAGYQWEGRSYPHKEVSVVYVEEQDAVVVLTCVARYGRWETKR